MTYATSLVSSMSIAEKTTHLSQIRSTLQHRPSVQIIFKGGNLAESRLPRAFTTGDQIRGDVTILSPYDCRFDDIYITLEGNMKVWSDMITGTSKGGRRSEVTKIFLKMVQPMDESSMPLPRIAHKDVKYTFPFSFVVPEQLLDNQCHHHITNSSDHESLRQQHLYLPPSLGTGKALSHDNTLQPDDVAPDMTKIRYAVRVRLCKNKTYTHDQSTLVDESKEVYIIPRYFEALPIKDDSYVMYKEKELRKGMFKGKLGKLSVFSDVPRPIEIDTVRNCPASIAVPVYLTFIPANERQEPPKLGTLTTKIKYHTHFSTRPISYTPSRKSHVVDGMLHHYEESATLSSRCLGGLEWQRGDGDDRRDSGYHSMISRRASGVTIESDVSSSVDNSIPIYYTSTVLVPVIQPKEKALTPTFHSCHISRSYELDISLSVQDISRLSPTIQLKLPLQVITSGGLNDGNLSTPPAFEDIYTSSSPTSYYDVVPQEIPTYSMSMANATQRTTTIAAPPDYTSYFRLR